MNENNRRGGRGVCYSRATEGHRHGDPSTSYTNRDSLKAFLRAERIQSDTESIRVCAQV